MPTILLVDDEKLPMEYYTRAFKIKEYEIRQFFDPDRVLDYIENKKPPPDAIILDIMMPPGDKYIHEDTDDGLKTGILLYKDLRHYYPSVPIVFLTNVSDPDIPKLPGESDNTLIVAQKIDYPPFELVKLVEDLITRSRHLEAA